MTEPLALGIGNALRGDDGVGPAAIEALRRAGAAGVRTGVVAVPGPDLFERWEPDQVVVVIDAACSGASPDGDGVPPPGTVHRLDARAAPLPAGLLRLSTHTGGLASAIELARALGRLPRALVVLAVEGTTWAPGTALSPPVARAVAELPGRIRRELGLDPAPEQPGGTACTSDP